MTQEQKAQAYDEVREKIALRFGSNVAEEIFSEFEMSEDERIRKWLYGYFRSLFATWIHPDITCGEILDWLEKQGGNKKEWLFEKDKWYVKLCHDYEGDLRHFEKGHAYKAVSEVKITDGYHNISLSAWQIPKYFRPANQDEIQEELEKKTTLDENEEIRNYFINAVNEQVDIHPEWKEKCLAWLEKQGETFTKKDVDNAYIEGMAFAKDELEKQKPTWSEEDERLCSCLIKEQEESLDNVRNDKYGHSEIISDLKDMYHERIDWLKSLRSRSRWKPSEEQMKALDSVIDEYDGYPEFDSLVSLKNDLKKL